MAGPLLITYSLSFSYLYLVFFSRSSIEPRLLCFYFYLFLMTWMYQKSLSKTFCWFPIFCLSVPIHLLICLLTFSLSLFKSNSMLLIWPQFSPVFPLTAKFYLLTQNHRARNISVCLLLFTFNYLFVRICFFLSLVHSRLCNFLPVACSVTRWLNYFKICGYL